jgi:hypothetical protein
VSSSKKRGAKLYDNMVNFQDFLGRKLVALEHSYLHLFPNVLFDNLSINTKRELAVEIYCAVWSRYHLIETGVYKELVIIVIIILEI